MLDYLIRGGTVCDGQNEQSYIADVGISGDRIAGIGSFPDAVAKFIIDASGKYVLPGMIDVHSHSDIWLFDNPDREEAITQGITTEIVGPCGIGVFPLTGDGNNYLKTVRAIIGDSIRSFTSCGEYLSSLPKTSLNVAAHVSHSPLRGEAMGYADVIPTQDNQKKLLYLTRMAFEEGACALSTGLAYFPAAYGSTDEVASLCKVAKEFDAPVCIHQRTALRKPDPSFSSKEEVLEFARRSGARLQYSHFRTTPSTAGKVEELLEPIYRGLSEGLSITADFYPFPIGAGYTAVILPMWAMENGIKHTLAILSDPKIRPELVKEVLRNNPMLKNGVVIHAPKHPGYIGRTYEDIADERGQDVTNMLLDMLLEEELDVGYQLIRNFRSEDLIHQEKDFVALLEKPFYMLGSDSLPGQMHRHPRSSGAFAKMLRLAFKYDMNMATFAKHVSSNPAGLFGLAKRGSLQKGYYADLIVVDGGNVTESATFENPWGLSKGVEKVFVNGTLTCDNGKLTGSLAGRALYRGKE